MSRCCPLGAYHSAFFFVHIHEQTLSRCSSAYSPRAAMSNMHASPADAVRIFRDVRAKKALAMHWG
jgi:L-ascorbate metabolism protein UlaG (beta-lactamase superfamily)